MHSLCVTKIQFPHHMRHPIAEEITIIHMDETQTCVQGIRYPVRPGISSTGHAIMNSITIVDASTQVAGRLLFHIYLSRCAYVSIH